MAEIYLSRQEVGGTVVDYLEAFYRNILIKSLRLDLASNSIGQRERILLLEVADLISVTRRPSKNTVHLYQGLTIVVMLIADAYSDGHLPIVT